MGVLKLGVLHVGCKPSTEGKTGSWGFNPYSMPGVRFMVRECLILSCLFLCGYFLTYPVCRSCLASFWIFQRYLPHVQLLVHPWEGSSGAS